MAGFLPVLSSRRSGHRLLAASPLVLGLCLVVPLLLAFPRVAEGLREGEAV